jgi:enoyl-CoA hydratase
MGICGVEFWQHPYEMSVRQAKEWLMTGGWVGAEEARARGMVNQVVPRAELSARTLELAQTIAARNPFTMKLVKQAMNFAQDQMGRKASADFGFHLHQMGHMQALLTGGFPIDIDSMPPAMQATIRKAIAARDAAAAK